VNAVLQDTLAYTAMLVGAVVLGVALRELRRGLRAARVQLAKDGTDGVLDHIAEDAEKALNRGLEVAAANDAPLAVKIALAGAGAAPSPDLGSPTDVIGPFSPVQVRTLPLTIPVSPQPADGAQKPPQ